MNIIRMAFLAGLLLGTSGKMVGMQQTASLEPADIVNSCVILYGSPAWDTDGTYRTAIGAAVQTRMAQAKAAGLVINSQNVDATCTTRAIADIITDVTALDTAVGQAAAQGMKVIHLFTYGIGRDIAAVMSYLLSLKTAEAVDAGIDVTAAAQKIADAMNGVARAEAVAQFFVNVVASQVGPTSVKTTATAAAMNGLNAAEAAFKSRASTDLQDIVKAKDVNLAATVQSVADEPTRAIKITMSPDHIQELVTALTSGGRSRARLEAGTMVMVHVFGSDPLGLNVPFNTTMVTLYEYMQSAKIASSCGCCASVSDQNKAMVGAGAKAAMNTVIKLAAPTVLEALKGALS